jgi:2-polyprenyl-6-hydroxyphenyl methylase/3-demethylubiquinone-9 3-methyltransferase
MTEALFDRDGWWDPRCRAFASLRSASVLRLELLGRWLGPQWHGRTVVDLGCGGGLLALPLAKAGARVLGVDLARQALQEARRQDEGEFLPLVGDLASVPVATGCADVVLLADVIEHVSDPAAAVKEAARLLRAGGSLFVNTLHRTLRSRLFAVVLGEGLGFIPRGTHDWHQFVRPDELEHMAAAAGLVRRELTGESPRLLRTVFTGAVVLRESRTLAVGYAALYGKL